MTKSKLERWHPSQEDDELIFAVCNRFLSKYGKGETLTTDREERSAASISKWLREERGRNDLSREKVYPLFREAVRRNFLHLQPPVENVLARRLIEHFHLENTNREISVVNVTGPETSQHVTSVAADKVIALIDRVAMEKRRLALINGTDPDQQAVHLGMGAGYATMLLAKRLANRVAQGGACPRLVLHAISSGGFFIDEPHKSPTTYFSYFDDTLSEIEYVALFSETVVHSNEYEKVKKNPGLRRCFDRKSEIDIIVTSLADAEHSHGLLGQYLGWLTNEGLIDSDVVSHMRQRGWVGDVQFRPYTKEGELENVCPVRAVALFEIDEMVRFAKKPNHHLVLIGGPCGECGASKTEALRPLLTNERLRLWNHLVTDVRTARELLDAPRSSLQ